MSYFRELPNIEYQSFLSDAISSNDYLVVKNLFAFLVKRKPLKIKYKIMLKGQEE